MVKEIKRSGGLVAALSGSFAITHVIAEMLCGLTRNCNILLPLDTKAILFLVIFGVLGLFFWLKKI